MNEGIILYLSPEYVRKRGVFEIMHAFLSYQTVDKGVAGEVRIAFEGLGIQSFLAHEDITVSQEWQQKIMEKIGSCDLFVALLSENYYGSPYCVQESGIAVFREEMTIIPLSIDGAVPRGFFTHIQSSKIDPGNISSIELLAGIAEHDCAFVINETIKIIAGSNSFRDAEANFRLILPYLGNATKEQIIRLLETASDNGQVCDANLCAKEYLPSLLENHGRLLDNERRARLEMFISSHAE